MTQSSEQGAAFLDDSAIPQASEDVARWRADLSYRPPFQVRRWRVVDEVWGDRSAIDAVVEVEVEGREDLGAASGVGGVNALDRALRRVLIPHFPVMEDVQLVELYTHRGGHGTDAEVFSIMKFSDGRRQWSTMRKSRDLLGSACLALIDGYEWAITKECGPTRR